MEMGEFEKRVKKCGEVVGVGKKGLMAPKKRFVGGKAGNLIELILEMPVRQEKKIRHDKLQDAADLMDSLGI